MSTGGLRTNAGEPIRCEWYVPHFDDLNSCRRPSTRECPEPERGRPFRFCTMHANAYRRTAASRAVPLAEAAS